MTTETPAKGRHPEDDTTPIHVLLVDADPALLSLAERLLAAEIDLTVATAENALDACRTVREEG
jgi:DNA-binding NtrC family response regulator